MELKECKKCNIKPTVELFYNSVYIICEKCRATTRDYEYSRDAFIEWNEIND